jgi:hypothetical protein
MAPPFGLTIAPVAGWRKWHTIEEDSQQQGEDAMDDRPLWRQFYDAFDKQLAPRLEQFVRTEQFADMMAAASRMNQAFLESVSTFNRSWLNLLNLPSRSELVDVKQQLAAIDRRLVAITKTLQEEADHDR